jgi:hypothetical protein
MTPSSLPWDARAIALQYDYTVETARHFISRLQTAAPNLHYGSMGKDVMARELRRREHSADKMSLTTESTPLLSRKREKQLAEEVERTVWIGLHPIVTLQHGSTTLYQVSYHIQ